MAELNVNIVQTSHLFHFINVYKFEIWIIYCAIIIISNQIKYACICHITVLKQSIIKNYNFGNTRARNHEHSKYGKLVKQRAKRPIRMWHWRWIFQVKFRAIADLFSKILYLKKGFTQDLSKLCKNTKFQICNTLGIEINIFHTKDFRFAIKFLFTSIVKSTF